MEVFNSYAKYYDLVYKDKDYLSEADYIVRLISKYKPGAKKLLDLGCGTGRHDLVLSGMGFDITGVEQSQSMLDIATKNLNKNGFDKGSLKFIKGDIRNINLNERFDVIISLFHVISYQTSNNDLLNAFNNAKKHLDKNGIFIFDFWYGPAVLSQKPEKRMRKFEDDSFIVERKAEPAMHMNENIVDVNFTISVKNRKDDSEEKICEKHSMRYLFIPEIDLMLQNTGLKIRYCREWITERELDEKSWSGIIVSEAI